MWFCSTVAVPSLPLTRAHNHAHTPDSLTHKHLSQEAFLFQVMSDDTGNHSLWVAQRVPDDHVGTVMNAFTVREVSEGGR